MPEGLVGAVTLSKSSSCHLPYSCHPARLGTSFLPLSQGFPNVLGNRYLGVLLHWPYQQSLFDVKHLLPRLGGKIDSYAVIHINSCFKQKLNNSSLITCIPNGATPYGRSKCPVDMGSGKKRKK